MHDLCALCSTEDPARKHKWLQLMGCCMLAEGTIRICGTNILSSIWGLGFRV